MECHSSPAAPVTGSAIALIGHPNVGKSVIFNRLTGQRVAISNYPGTTVEMARGVVTKSPDLVLIDTPGVITFPPHSDDEQVTARVLLEESLRGIVQVGDAKNLRRTLLLTVQLAEMGRPLVIVLNMMDEAVARGVEIDPGSLSNALRAPFISATAVKGQGVDRILTELQSAQPAQVRLDYPEEVEACLEYFTRTVSGQPEAESIPIEPRSLALLFLSGDGVSESWLQARLDPTRLEALWEQRAHLNASLNGRLAARIQQTRLEYVDQLVRQAMLNAGHIQAGWQARLGRLSTHPVWGLAVLAVVLYGVYLFVGVFGASTLVGWFEKRLFGEILNPRVTGFVQHLIPWKPEADFFVGQYGLWTMGMTYALALILPIVTTFFLAFGILEDSGYLPRLAALSNRLFETLGLNGKAVLPMVLGLGCVTMATLTTRVLETRRERLIVTLLLALAIPCSAQLGVVMGMLASVSLFATLLWAGVVLAIMLLVGWLAARLMPGERSALLVELPPLRLPQFSNVLLKTLARLEWYIKEVIPLFLIGAALMFVLDQTGVLKVVVKAGEPLVTGWLGLPPEASAAFLMGFLRRDFGATGLFVMRSQGLMTPIQVIVAMVTITLFIPCIASVMMIAKERGWRSAIRIMTIVFPLAFLAGGLLNRALLLIGWNA